MTIRWLLAIALLAPISTAVSAVGSGPFQALPQNQTAPAGNSDNGRKLFVSYGCYQWHGYEAQGSNATGPRLGPKPIAFAQLTKYVRAPTGQMPPYTTKVLADPDLTDIYAFLQSRPQPAAVDSIPLLK
jgi:ubiquinol-cytochrome c reductase cytochrome c subunit